MCAQTLVLGPGAHQEFQAGPPGIIINNPDGTQERIGKALIGGTALNVGPFLVGGGSPPGISAIAFNGPDTFGLCALSGFDQFMDVVDPATGSSALGWNPNCPVGTNQRVFTTAFQGTPYASGNFWAYNPLLGLPSVVANTTIDPATGNITKSGCAAGSVFLATGAGCQTKPVPDTRDYAGATSDVRITNAIAAMPSTGGVLAAIDVTNQSWAACPTWGANPVHLVLNPVTYTAAVNCTIPKNVTLQFRNGAMITGASNTTVITFNGSIVAGSYQQIFGSTGLFLPNRTEPWISWWGVLQENADNTDAINRAFQSFGTNEAWNTWNGGGGGMVGTLHCAQGAYFHLNELWYLGGNGAGMRVLGPEENIAGNSGCAFIFKTAIDGVGTSQEFISGYDSGQEYVTVSGFAGTGRYPKRLLWHGANVGATPSTSSLTSVACAASICTGTTTASHSFVQSDFVLLSGTTIAALNRPIRIINVPAATTFTFYYTGQDGNTATGGSVTRPVTDNSLYDYVRHSNFGNWHSPNFTIVGGASVVSDGSSNVTITFPTNHNAQLGDNIVLTGCTPNTFNSGFNRNGAGNNNTLSAGYTVLSNAAITSSTTLHWTAAQLAGLSIPISTTATTCTINVESDALVWGATPAGNQVSGGIVEDSFFNGNGDGTSGADFMSFGGANTKNFLFQNVNINGATFGWTGFNSGSFNVTSQSQMGGVGDANVNHPVGVVFYNNSPNSGMVSGGELENSEARLYVNGGSNNFVSFVIENLQWQSSTPAFDDILIATQSTLELHGNYFASRLGTLGNPARICCYKYNFFTPNQVQTLKSEQNEYAGAQTYLPVEDLPNGNFLFTGSDQNPFLVRTISSTLDLGGISGGIAFLQPIRPIGISELVNYTTTNVASVASGAHFLGADTDCLMAWRNHANSGDVTLCKNTSDQMVTPALLAPSYFTATNCAVNSASPAACGSAAAGAVVIPTTTTTYTINTTAVTAASRIRLSWLSFASNLPSAPTCVAPSTTTMPTISAISAGVSFTIALTSTTGQTCPMFEITN